MPVDPKLLIDGPSDSVRTIALAHGAGAGMDSPFMEFFAKGLGNHGFRVVRFEYPYMTNKRITGKSKPPDREPVLRVGKPDQLRVEHLQAIKTPTLIVQGERDPFGTREEVAEYKLSAAIQVAWLGDGDHSFKPRKSSGRTEQQNWEAGLCEIVRFLESIE